MSVTGQRELEIVERFKTKGFGFISRYEKLQPPIGEGAFGVVYKARDHSTNTFVAIKEMSISHHAAKSELDKVIKVPEHQNIVSYLGNYMDGSKLSIVMELCDCDMERYYTHLKVVPIDASINFMMQCMKAVQFLHKHGIVHRDLKPQNIMLKSGIIKIADFGLAKVAEYDPVLLRQVKTFLMETECGTPFFMAPEIGTNMYSKSVDIFAMGRVILWMLTFRQLYGPSSTQFAQLGAEMSCDEADKRPRVEEVIYRLQAV